MAQQSGGKKISFKLVCLGAVSVGKTSLSLQYVENQFVPTKATIAGKRRRARHAKAQRGPLFFSSEKEGKKVWGVF